MAGRGGSLTAALTNAQTQAIYLFVDGMSKAKISRRLGVNRSTLDAWMRKPVWVDAYRVAIVEAEQDLVGIPVASRRWRLARLQQELEALDEIEAKPAEILAITAAVVNLLDRARTETAVLAALPAPPGGREVNADYWTDDTRSEPEKLAAFLNEVESLARQWEALGFTVEAFLARLRRLLPKEIAAGADPII
jgi:transposase-like protein